MMTPTASLLFRASLLATVASACGGGGGENPDNLWLAPNGGETSVKLVDHFPGIF